MTTVNYQKRKNTELFKSLENSDSLFLSDCQNYIPVYNSFFALNETNYNNINFNHELYLTSVGNKAEDDVNIYNCSLKSLSTNKPKKRDVFFKYAPLLDPYKFLIGKYAGQDISVLPDLKLEAHPKFNDVNNTAYIDGLFTYLSSKLIYEHNFVHGVDYYGSFLAFKRDLKLDILDDYEHLSESDYFKKHTNVDFFMKDISKLPPITINYDSNHELFVCELDDEYFVSDEMFDDLKEVVLDELMESCEERQKEGEEKDLVKTVRSDSTCSSRSSHTSCSDELNEDDLDHDDDDDFGDSLIVTIPKFPVHVIALECCDATLDDLILDSELKSDDEWHSAFMQIFMILITYQKAFGLTHNDLHTNNVMFVETKKKHLCYLFNGKYYKVPTYGRLYKIIDFGRSIYKVNGKRFCSDSFRLGGDAATQYNTEPFMDETKSRIEPNFSFDICRLACSIYDYIIRDDDVGQNIKDLVSGWCVDDKGANVLYKTNGQERYPDFKLYKMIARTVHHHTPQIQLIRPEFHKYEVFKGETQNVIIDIDAIPSF